MSRTLKEKIQTFLSIKKWIFVFSLVSLTISQNAFTSDLRSSYRCETIFNNSQADQKSSLQTQNSTQKAIGDFYEPAYIPTGITRNQKNTRNLDQCRSDECYLFAFLGAIEVRNQNFNKIKKNPAFSGAYLFAKKLMNYSDGLIQYGQGNTYHTLNGGHFYDAFDLAKTHGLMPEESWQPQVPFAEWDFARIYQSIDIKGQEWNQKINQLAQENGTDSLKVAKAYRKGLDELHSLIYSYTGYIPDVVDFRNQKLSPREIEQIYGIDRRVQISMMYPKNRFQDEYITTKKLTDLTQSFGTQWKYTPEDFGDIETRMMKSIQDGTPVIVDIDWLVAGGHSMVVVDYEIIHGKLSRWKLKNSWGDSFGDQGHAWYTYKDLRKNLRRAWLFEM